MYSCSFTLSFAAPLVVMGGVTSLGFGTEGIVVAGSTAAAMMPAEATVVAGDGIVAGGTVAMLQSIGVAGLGFAGRMTMAVSGGALAGWIVGRFTTASALVRNNDNRSQATLQQKRQRIP